MRAAGISAPSPLWGDVQHGKIQHLEQAVICRENSLGFSHLKQLPIEALYGISRINQSPKLLWELEICAEMLCRYAPACPEFHHRDSSCRRKQRCSRRISDSISYPGAEVHEFIALFLECGQVKDEMRLIDIRLEVAFKENCKRPVLAYHLAGNSIQLGAYSAEDSGVFFSGYE